MGSSLQVSPCSDVPGGVELNCPRVLINRDMVATYDEKIAIDKKNHQLVDLNESRNRQRFKFDHALNRRDIFLGGDLQEQCIKIIEALGWKEEYEKLVKGE